MSTLVAGPGWGGDGGGGRLEKGKEGMLTVLVVVAHLGFLGLGTGNVDGVFDDADLLGVGRAGGGGGVNGGAGDVGGLGVVGAGAGGVDGELVNGGGGLVGGTEARGVDGGGGGGHGELLAVVGLDTRTILALGNVDDGVVRAVGGIELDTRLVVGGLRSDVRGRDGSVGMKREEGKRKEEEEEMKGLHLMSMKRRGGLACLSLSPRVAWSTQPPPAPDHLGREPKQGGRWRLMETEKKRRKRRGREGDTARQYERIKTKTKRH